MTDKHVTVGAGIPSEMAEAMLKAQGEMPSLKKEDRNNFAKYNFVSIDGFYAAIPQVAARHGLYWQTHELNYEIIGNSVAYTYGHDLFFKTGTCLPNYSRTTVIHPIQGAQTAGSALSYAEKLFMRSAFKVVTGEEDADSTDNTKPQPVPARTPRLQTSVGPVAEAKPATEPAKIIGGIAEGGVKVTDNDGVPVIEAPKEGSGWKPAAEVFKTFVPSCSTVAELRSFWTANSGVLDKMEKGDKPTYDEVKSVFTVRQTELKKKEK